MTFLQERISKGMLDIVDLFAMDVVSFLLQEADVKMRKHPWIFIHAYTVIYNYIGKVDLITLLDILKT